MHTNPAEAAEVRTDRITANLTQHLLATTNDTTSAAIERQPVAVASPIWL